MKSQSSTEFMVFIGIAIIILISYFAIAHFYLNLTYKQKDVISGQDFAKQMKNEINLASRVEDGYVRTLILPTTVGNKDYTINIQGREVSIKIEGLDYVELLTTNIDMGEETINPGDTISITKTNGIVGVHSSQE